MDKERVLLVLKNGLVKILQAVYPIVATIILDLLQII